MTTWANVKEFKAKFRLLRDDNEIVEKIYSTEQEKNETICVYARRLKELVEKMESPLADGLRKQWFVKRLLPTLWKKIKNSTSIIISRGI